MQQIIANETPSSKPAPSSVTHPLRLNAALVVYAVMIALSIAMRLGALGEVPMSPTESPAALAAWRGIMNQSPIEVTQYPESPAVFWAQRIAFSVLGSTELAARVLTSIAGIIIVFTPLLFRDLLGDTRTLMLCALLMISPVLTIATRTSEGMVWAVLFAALMLWMFKRWWLARRAADGVWAGVFAVLMLIFADADGIILGGVLLIAAVGAALLTSWDRTREDSFAESGGKQAPLLPQISEALRTFPLLQAIGLGVLLVVLITTGFMTYPAGLNTLSALFRDLTQADAGIPIGYPFGVALFYEPLLPLFIIGGLWLMKHRLAFTFTERFMIVWLIAGTVAAFTFGRTTPAAALWVTLPAAGLASYGAAGLLFRARIPFLPVETLEDQDAGHLYSADWGKWLIAIVFTAFFIILIVHLSVIARSILMLAGGTDVFFAALSNNPGYDMVRLSLVWSAVSVLLMGTGYMLAAGVWGGATTLQGVGIGLLMILGASGLSAGWYASVFNASNPVELWHTRTTTAEYPLLRETLTDLSRRRTQGEPTLPIVVVRDPATGLTEESPLAWALRDYLNVEFVASLDAARGTEIVITPLQIDSFGIVETQPLTGLEEGYAGQRFVTQRLWRMETMRPEDTLAWILQRRTRFAPEIAQAIVLWVRTDILSGQEPLAGSLQ